MLDSQAKRAIAIAVRMMRLTNPNGWRAECERIAAANRREAAKYPAGSELHAEFDGRARSYSAHAKRK